MPLKNKQKLIGIDGLSGAGKTTLAKKIQKQLGAVTIICIDEFYKPESQRTIGLIKDATVSPDFDWERLEREIFRAIAAGEPMMYRRYLWREDRWGETIAIPRNHLIIIEGIYALQRDVRDSYDFTIWVEAPRDVRIARMIAREGEAVARNWQEKWLPREEYYFETERPDEAASTIFENTSG